MKFKHKKIALYVRVSKLDQDPEYQEAELRRYADFHGGDVVAVYRDRMSGAKDTRPELDRLMRDARKNAFNHVIFWKIDRLGRNAVHTQTVVNEWKRRGITFTITTLDIDTSTTAGRFIFGVFAQFAEMERDLTIERTQAKIDYIQKELAEKGSYRTKNGRVITKLGRPKGAKDKKKRKRKSIF
jgi:DNA invertase Pin-like site-specific DNA recombinase